MFDISNYTPIDIKQNIISQPAIFFLNHTFLYSFSHNIYFDEYPLILSIFFIL